MQDPLIDVVIPVFNAEATLRAAVASIQRQTVDALRIIVVNDGCTDASPAILRDIAATDGRIRILDQRNAGIVAALNAGLAAARAPLLARHDADDLADPQRLAAQMAYLDANPGCVALSCAVRPIDAQDRLIGDPVRVGSPAAADLDAVPTREPYLIHPFLMARRAALVAVGGYRHVHHAEDTDLYWRLSEQGRLHNLPDTLGDHRIHAGSVTGRSLVNGRISATFSQLAALSARRRREGRPDLRFPPDDLPAYVAAASLAAIVARAAVPLDAAERARLEVTVAAKMLELAGYKPYELDRADCRFIHAALRRHRALIRPQDRLLINRMWAGTTARLLGKGLVTEAASLASRHIWPAAATRLVLRFGPATARRWVRRRTGQAQFTK